MSAKFTHDQLSTALEDIAVRAYDVSLICTQAFDSEEPTDISTQAAILRSIRAVVDQIGCIADHYAAHSQYRGNASDWMLPDGYSESTTEAP